MSSSMTVPVTDHLGPGFEDTPFRYVAPDEGRMFDPLLGGDGKYHCPYPDCGEKSTGAQGIGRHLTFKHDWQRPKNRPISHGPNKTRKKAPVRAVAAPKKARPHPSDGARKEKVTCPYIANGKPCGRELRKDYLRHHLRDFHHVPLDRIDSVLSSVLSSQPRQAAPLQDLQLLEAPEICMSVLETVSPNGSIPIRAMAAYQVWVEQTSDFLKVFYDRES